MKRLAVLSFRICAALLLLGLGVRLLWVASRPETGFETLGLQWRDATLGWVLGGYEPVHKREPLEQAEFWLPEVDRVLRAHPDDSRLAMGAALTLDNASTGFLAKYMKRIETVPGFGPFPRLDKEGIRRAEDAFEKRCSKRCLELAARATELDPANVEWWRLRALLLWRYSLYSYDGIPRDPNWLNILEQCACHDPGNALYDYLATFFHWEASLDMDIVGGNERLVVKDDEGLQRGVDCYLIGQSKPYVAVGDAGFTAAAEFLSHTRFSPFVHIDVVNSRGIHFRRSVLLRHVWDWQGLRANERASAGDVEGSLALQRQNLHLISQFANAGPSQVHDQVALASKVTTAGMMKTLAQEHKDGLIAPEIQEIVGLYETAMLELKVLEQASRELAKSKNRSRAGLSFRPTGPTLAAWVIVNVAPASVVLLLLTGLTAAILSRVATDNVAPVVGPIGHTVALVAAIAVTVVAVGLAPARIISVEVQAWILTILVILTPIALALWIGWQWLRRRAFKYSLRAMLISVSLLCMLFGFVSLARPDAESFRGLPFDLSIPVRDWEGLDGKSFGNAIPPDKRWFWAMLQWPAYHGHHLTVAVWAGFVMVLYSLKIRKRQWQAAATAWNLRKRLGGLLRSLGKPALVLSAVMLMTYFALAPTVVRHVEQEFQQKIAFARDPDSHWTKVENAVRKIRSNNELMTQLWEDARAEARQSTDSASEI